MRAGSNHEQQSAAPDCGDDPDTPDRADLRGGLRGPTDPRPLRRVAAGSSPQSGERPVGQAPDAHDLLREPRRLWCCGGVDRGGHRAVRALLADPKCKVTGE
jgi:hypothetical protein